MGFSTDPFYPSLCTLHQTSLSNAAFALVPPPNLPFARDQYAEANKGATQLTVSKEDRKNFPIEDFVSKNKLELVRRLRDRLGDGVLTSSSTGRRQLLLRRGQVEGVAWKTRDSLHTYERIE